MTLLVKIASFIYSNQMAISTGIRNTLAKNKPTTPRVIAKPWPWYLAFLYEILKTLVLTTLGLSLAVILVIVRFLITGEA